MVKPGVFETLKKPKGYFGPTQQIHGPYHHDVAPVSWCCLPEAYCLIQIPHTLFKCPLENCASCYARCCPLLRSLQWTQSSVKSLSIYNWQNRESFMQRLDHSTQDISYPILFCSVTNSFCYLLFGNFLYLYNSGPDLKKLPCF